MVKTEYKRTKPLRDVEVEVDIDNSKCMECEDKPCLEACPIDAVKMEADGQISIGSDCFGCVLCRNACPYDAIHMETILEEPYQENVPNINTKLCRQCGACVEACKTGSIHIKSTGNEEAHSVIDEDTCIRCGYCYRACPFDAIKYGEILPKSVKAGKAIKIHQEDCIGCMTCVRVCPSKGAINIGKISKLPYIDPSYCARCEECMRACPGTVIKYSSRKKSYEEFNKIKSTEIAYDIIEHESKNLNRSLAKLNKILSSLLKEISSSVSENTVKLDVTEKIITEFDKIIGDGLEITYLDGMPKYFSPVKTITVLEDECIGCGECISECPIGCIEPIYPSPVLIGDDCIFCAKCVEKCKCNAIKLIEESFIEEDGRIFFTREDITSLRDCEFHINHDFCQSCTVCINICPVNALSLVNDEIVCDEDLCIYCRACEGICPVNAIKIISK